MATVLNFPRFPKVESENVVTVLKKHKKTRFERKWLWRYWGWGSKNGDSSKFSKNSETGRPKSGDSSKHNNKI